MDNTKNGKLVVNYIRDEENYHCTCDCGTRIILTKEQFSQRKHCGCEHRKYLRSLVGMEDEEQEIRQNTTIPHSSSRGVNFYQKKNKWRARIIFQSKEYHLGYFSEKETAIEMRMEAEKHLGNGFLEWYDSIQQKDAKSKT